MQIIAGSNSVDFAKKLADHLDWEIILPNYKFYKDGEAAIQLPKLPSEDVLIIQSLYSPQDTHLFQLFNLISTIKRLGTIKITLYTPYLAYARSDREVIQFEAISAKTVVEILEKIGVNHLIVLDVHNPEISKYATQMKFTNIYPVKSIAKYFEETLGSLSDITIVAPDKGASERARLLAESLKIPHVSLDKFRDPQTGEVEVTTNSVNISTTQAILVDDIVATGTSLVQASSLLSMMGVSKIHFFITHFLSTEALDRIKEISSGVIVASHSVPSVISKILTIEDLCEVLMD